MQNNALLYSEPNITIILVLASFLLLLNVVGYTLDRLFYCGLVGQIFIGVSWGIPGTKWLTISMQESVTKLGYLGLILLVYEGGLSSNIKAIRANLLKSSLAALTGVLSTIGISFILIVLASASPLQSFAAGAALSSTSLGTTFTLLKNSGLVSSHSGVIIASAAVLDDISGLIMAQVISKLGSSDSPFSSLTVIRPVFVSIAFAVGVPGVCRILIKPLAGKFRAFQKLLPSNIISELQFSFLMHTAILIGFVVASSYAGTSNLFGAYLAGASISWYDNDIVAAATLEEGAVAAVTMDEIDLNRSSIIHVSENNTRSDEVIQETFHRQVDIEYPNPVLFKRQDKEVTSQSTTNINFNDNQESRHLEVLGEHPQSLGAVVTGNVTWHAFYEKPVSFILKPFFFSSIGFSIPISQMFEGSIVWRGLVFSIMMVLAKLLCGIWLIRFCRLKKLSCALSNNDKVQNSSGIKSIYPAMLVGSAMVARGEVGFLIAAIAQGRGIFSSEQFLVVIWSIMICTIIGPITVGVLTQRLDKRQALENFD